MDYVSVTTLSNDPRAIPLSWTQVSLKVLSAESLQEQAEIILRVHISFLRTLLTKYMVINFVHFNHRSKKMAVRSFVLDSDKLRQTLFVKRQESIFEWFADQLALLLIEDQPLEKSVLGGCVLSHTQATNK